MHISPSEEFGIRCLLTLAKSQHSQKVLQSADNTKAIKSAYSLSASKVAEKEGLSIEYVSKLLFYFRKAGIVQASRGAHGGFFLARSPGEISLKDAFEAVSADTRRVETNFCNHFSGQQKECVHLDECCVRPVWAVLSAYFDDVLKHITLADLLDDEKSVRKKMKLFAQSSARELDHLFGPVMKGSEGSLPLLSSTSPTLQPVAVAP